MESGGNGGEGRAGVYKDVIQQEVCVTKVCLKSLLWKVDIKRRV